MKTRISSQTTNMNNNDTVPSLIFLYEFKKNVRITVARPYLDFLREFYGSKTNTVTHP